MGPGTSLRAWPSPRGAGNELSSHFMGAWTVSGGGHFQRRRYVIDAKFAAPEDGVASDALAAADGLVVSGDMAGGALAYVALVDAYPDSSEVVLVDGRLDDILSMLDENTLDPVLAGSLLDGLPTLSSMNSAAGRHALFRLYLAKLDTLDEQQEAALVLRESLLDALLDSLWEFQEDAPAYLLAEDAVRLAESWGRRASPRSWRSWKPMWRPRCRAWEPTRRGGF
jgi:hypothetical protein